MKEPRALADIFCICAYQGYSPSVLVMDGRLAEGLVVDQSDDCSSDHNSEAIQTMLIHALGYLKSVGLVD